MTVNKHAKECGQEPLKIDTMKKENRHQHSEFKNEFIIISLDAHISFWRRQALKSPKIHLQCVLYHPF
jgi:hypothetical protein